MLLLIEPIVTYASKNPIPIQGIPNQQVRKGGLHNSVPTQTLVSISIPYKIKRI